MLECVTLITILSSAFLLSVLDTGFVVNTCDLYGGTRVASNVWRCLGSDSLLNRLFENPVCYSLNPIDVLLNLAVEPLVKPTF